MSVCKYKLKLEAAIYECNNKYYIGGKIVEEVLEEYHAERLNLQNVSNNEAKLKALLQRLLDNNMCSIVGDELIVEVMGSL